MDNQLIMISGEHCGYCRYIEPLAEKLCDDNDILFIKLQSGNLPNAIPEPKALPTFIFRVDSEMKETWSGSKLDKLKEKLANYFGSLK